MTHRQPGIGACAVARPPLATAMLRGALNRCPACGEAKLFKGNLAPEPVCARCGTALGAIRTDDAPPYVTIFLVGHIVIPLLLLVEQRGAPPLWLMAAFFLPLALALTLLLLRPVKGVTLGLMLAFGMSGREQGPDLPDRPG